MFKWTRNMLHLASRKINLLEELTFVCGLIFVQIVYAGNAVFMGYLMSIGLRPYFLIVCQTVATFVVLLPPSFYFERHKWPKEFSLKLLVQLLVISFAGVTLFQGLMLLGIKKTSPAIASAMPNLAPGLIFIIAWSLRLEKVKLSCIYSKVKMVGTLLCIAGALMMSLFHASAATHNLITGLPAFDKDTIFGSMYLMAAVFVCSCNVVLQAATLGDFPAPISLCCITSLFGAILSAAAQLIQDRTFNSGYIVNVRELVGISLLVGMLGGSCVSFQNWAMKKRGPVLISMFGPIGTVCSVVLSAITLGDSVTLGSLLGMFLMFMGLYFVLWAKGKEICAFEDDLPERSMVYDVHKPLLS